MDAADHMKRQTRTIEATASITASAPNPSGDKALNGQGDVDRDPADDAAPYDAQRREPQGMARVCRSVEPSAHRTSVLFMTDHRTTHGPEAGRSADCAFDRRVPPRAVGIRVDERMYLVVVMDADETMNVSLGRTLLVVAASDGPPWIVAS
jgi:hypothetical protein